MTKPALLLLGAAGQLGQTLRALWPTVSISNDFRLSCLDIEQLDIGDSAAVNKLLSELNPRLIINTAAYTAVDAAEENRELAFKVNGQAVANLVQWTTSNSARLIHLSTDFVFSGDQNRAYTEQDLPSPRNVYGESKLKGEAAVLAQPACKSVIIRTSWLYSPYQKNFLKTMLQLMSERDQLKVVSDQIGTPTSCITLARFIFDIIADEHAAGIFHCSDAGLASWYDFAVAIFEEAKAINLLPPGKMQSTAQIQPISTAAYPTPAKRPVFSVLDKTRSARELNFAPDHWRQALRVVLQQLKQENWKPL